MLFENDLILNFCFPCLDSNSNLTINIFFTPFPRLISEFQLHMEGIESCIRESIYSANLYLSESLSSLDMLKGC